MINFLNDYNSPGHPDVLRAVAEAACRKYPGYGADAETERAKQKIVSMLGARELPPDRVHFLAGGTQTNLTAIGAFLRPHEAVVAPGAAHIQVHETGAIEAVGHRVLTARPADCSGSAGDCPEGAVQHSPHSPRSQHSPHSPRSQHSPHRYDTGKLGAGAVAEICEAHSGEHMVKPRLAYISQSTELGGVYTASELAGLRAACDKYGLYLYMDGARLGAALVSGGYSATAYTPGGSAATLGGADSRSAASAAYTPGGSAATLPDIAACCDAFYIGGTKNGLMFGEALVITNPSLAEDFRYFQKQRGGLLAKGFLLGLQFDAIFTGDLYFKLAAHANEMAGALRSGLEALGCGFLVDSRTNQIFPIINTRAAGALAGGFLFETWDRDYNGQTVIRLVTSWNTAPSEVEAFLSAYKKHR